MSGYLDFENTGVEEIDNILNAIWQAGTVYHHTSDWLIDEYGGETLVDRIQKAANRAADAMREAREIK